MALKVLRAGVLSSLQDLGRWGYQRFGVPVSGAMDETSHRLANWLVGNRASEASVEMTLAGPSFSTTTDTLVAVCGGDFEPRVNGRPMPHTRPVLVRKGSTLDFGPCRLGCRAYLAVAGGFAVEPVLASRSTFLRGGFGGFKGRALKRGDLLETGVLDPGCYPSLQRSLASSAGPIAYTSWSAIERVQLMSSGVQTIRFVPGRHWDWFAEETRNIFVESEYGIASNSDRQGYRLVGPVVMPRRSTELSPEGVTFGTIQVPPDGEPIVLMASHQTVGSYPRLGDVASVDLPLLAQLPPGAAVRFEPITVKQAHALLIAAEHGLARIREAILMRTES